MKSICFRLLLNLAAFVSFAFAVAVPTTAMADLIALKIPGIPGDVTVEGFEKQIEVISLSNNIVNSVTAQFGGGGGVGKAKFSDMIIHKRFDSSSPVLFLGLVTGKHFSNAVITFIRDDSGTLTSIFTIMLTEIVVTKFEIDAPDQNVLAGLEQINLNYTRIQLKDEVTGNQACFDVKKNAAC